jgi:NADPH2:quinone reductase
MGPYDVVLELVGGQSLGQVLPALAQCGRVVVIGTGAGGRLDLDLHQLMRKKAVLRGSMLRARAPEEKAMVARAIEHNVLPLLGAGRIGIPVAATYPFAEAQAAYDRFAAGSKFGKIVLVAQ